LVVGRSIVADELDIRIRDSLATIPVIVQNAVNYWVPLKLLSSFSYLLHQ
jgi:hypothetical protein